MSGRNERHGDVRLPIRSSGLVMFFFTTSASELPSCEARRKTSIGTCWLAATVSGLTDVTNLHVAGRKRTHHGRPAVELTPVDVCAALFGKGCYPPARLSQALRRSDTRR